MERLLIESNGLYLRKVLLFANLDRGGFALVLGAGLRVGSGQSQTNVPELR